MMMSGRSRLYFGHFSYIPTLASSEQLDGAFMGSSKASAPYTPWCRGWSDAKFATIPAVPCNGYFAVVADEVCPLNTL